MMQQILHVLGNRILESVQLFVYIIHKCFHIYMGDQVAMSKNLENGIRSHWSCGQVAGGE